MASSLLLSVLLLAVVAVLAGGFPAESPLTAESKGAAGHRAEKDLEGAESYWGGYGGLGWGGYGGWGYGGYGGYGGWGYGGWGYPYFGYYGGYYPWGGWSWYY